MMMTASEQDLATMEQRIQWLGESYHEDGYLHYYESCSLESIINAINQFEIFGVLKRTSRQKNKKAPVIDSFRVTTEFLDEGRMAELFEKISFYKVYSPTTQMSKMKIMLK